MTSCGNRKKEAIDGTRKERAALRTQGWAIYPLCVMVLSFDTDKDSLYRRRRSSCLALCWALCAHWQHRLSRDPSTARKLTDDVVDAFWYLTISLSLIVVFGALAGASADVTMGMGDGATLGRQLQKALCPGGMGFGRRTVGRHRYRTACSACGRRLLAVPQAAHDACRVYDNHRSACFHLGRADTAGRMTVGQIISLGRMLERL